MKCNALMVSALLVPGAGVFAAPDQGQPNIIFVLADDMGYGDAGFTGQQKIETPNMDQMAADGAIMANFYAGAPVCGPSRATLMYGQHTGHAPIRGNPRWTLSGNAPELAADAKILPKQLKRAGYATAHFGKWGLNEAENPAEGVGNPLKQGFDEFAGFNTHGEAHFHWPDYVWDGYEKVDWSKGEPGGNWENKYQYADDYFTEKTLDFIDRKAGKQPFFIYLGYTIPHKGYNVPKSSREYYEGRGWPVKKQKSGHYKNDPELHTAYAGMVTHMDAYLKEIREKLAEKGVADNTLIIFTSDNGHEIGSNFFNSGGGLRGKKRSVTDGGIHMPTVVVWPAVIKPGRVIETPLAFWDVLPTFCEMAGVKPAGETDGISFLPALKGDMANQPEHEVMYWEFNEKAGPMQAVRFGDWKAVRTWDYRGKKFKPVQLYNLKDDKGEANNLASAEPEMAKKALQYMINTRTEHPEFPLTPRKVNKKKWEQKGKGKK